MIRPGISILLAIAVGLSSPAWCCCALQAAAAVLLDETCEIAPTAGCCAGREAPVRACCHGSDDQESPCNCSERLLDQNRLDTAPKLVVPKPDRATVALVVRAGQCAPVMPIGQPVAARWCAPPNAPPRTLLGQYCLLLI